jgi:PAS domain S-box-containing protein
MEPYTKTRTPARGVTRQQNNERVFQGWEDGLATDETGCPGSGLTVEILRRAVDTSLCGICILDQQGCIIFANETLLSLWGYGEQELLGISADILWLSRREGPDIADCILDGRRWTGNVVARRKDSSLFDVRLSASSIQDKETAETGIILSCTDITAQRKAEDALSHRCNLERAISAMPSRFVDLMQIDASIDTSLEELGRVCGACRVYLALFNDQKTLLGTTHEWCLPGMTPQRGEFQKFLTSELPWWAIRILENEFVLLEGITGEARMSRQEREYLKRRGIAATLMVPLHLRETIIGFIGFDKSTDGAWFAEEDVALLHAAVHMIGNALEWKQSEYAFRESEDLYQIVLDAITDAVSVVDTDLMVLLANDAFTDWCEDLGLSSEVVGKNLFTVLPFLPTATRKQYERVVRTGRPLTTEQSYTLSDRTLTLREMRFPIFDQGEVTKIITVMRDVSAQKQVEDLKSKAYSQIERNMEQFALLADHIRNPLQAIMGRAELIDDAETTEKIRQQVRRINAIIDQLDERWAESRKLSTFWRKYS